MPPTDIVMEQTNADPGPRVWEKLGFSPLGLAALAALALLPFIPPFNQEYLIRWLIMACTLGAAAMAFDFSGGYIAVINFGFMGYFGLGAYTSGLAAIHWGWPPMLAMLAGALMAGLLGFLSGAVSLRLRGMMILCFTWFIGLALMGLATKLVDLTNGPRGLLCPPLYKDAGNLPYFYTILVMLLISYLILNAIVRSHIGLAFRAIGQNMEAARTSGISPLKFRILNFSLSCAIAGWIGGFYAHYYQVVTPELLSTGKTVEVLVIAYIGGRASLWGGAAAAVPFILGMEIIRSSLSHLPGLNLVLYGLFLILVMIYYPGGLAQVFELHVRNSRFPWVRRLAGTEDNG